MLKPKILLVEDDLGLAIPLKEFFEDNGLSVVHTADGAEVIPIYKKEMPSLLLMDIVLPHKSGFEIIEEIRKYDFQTPILLMTGSELSVGSEVRGYESGAIGYMRKPVAPQAVLAQIRTLLSMPALKHYRIGRHEIVKHKQQVWIDGRELKLREKEAQVFEILLDRYGYTVRRNTLLNSVWKEDRHELNSTLDHTIHSLREVLVSFPYLRIEGIYGEGYKIGKSIKESSNR